MKVTLIIWISAIILQEVEPGTLARIPRDVANLKSSLHTEYEANYKQKGKHGNDSYSTIKGNQEILHDNCNDTWNEFAEKCASLVKDLIASLANTISSSPGDATNLQLHIKNNFTHVDTSHKRNCFKRPPTCLSNLNFSSLFNNETGNILNKPNSDAPISVLTTLKKLEPCDESTPTPIQPNDEDIILENFSEGPQTSRQGSSLDYANGSHMNPEEAEGSIGPQINNNRRQAKYPASDLGQLEDKAVRSEESATDPSTSSRLPVMPINTEALFPDREPHVAFDPNDKSLEISAVPSNPPYNIRNTSPNPFFVNDLGDSENSNLGPSVFSENVSSRGTNSPGVADQLYSPSESSNEFLPNLVDRQNSLPQKFTSQQVSSEEEKYHTYLPPQSLVGEPLIGDSQQLREEVESEEKPDHNLRGHAIHEDNLPKMVNEEPPIPVYPHPSFTAATTAPPELLNSATLPVMSHEPSQSKEPSPPLLSADHTPDLTKTNASPHSISHQDPLQELKPPISQPPHLIGDQPLVTDDSTSSVLVPVSEPKKTQPEILPTMISNVDPLAKEVSPDDYSNENQPPSLHQSVQSAHSAEPHILSLSQSSNNPLEASNHLSQHVPEPVLKGQLVSSEENSENESTDDESTQPLTLLIPTQNSREQMSHSDKPSSLEQLETHPHHKTHHHPPPPHHHHHHDHPHHPHNHHGSTIPANDDGDDEKQIPAIVSEEKLLPPKRELKHPLPSHANKELIPVLVPEEEIPPPPPKIELVPVPPPEKELPPLPPKIELVPVPPPKKELPLPPPPPPPPPPPKIELVPVPPSEKELPPLPPKIELVPVPPPKKELPPPPPPPPPPKIELVPVPPPEKELPPLPPKIELVPIPPPEKELPKLPPKIELVPVSPPEKELPPLPPKIELVPVSPPEKELPKLPPKIELVPVSPPEKELPPLPPKIELVPVSPPEKELPKLPPKIELVPVPPPEKELPKLPPKIELVPVSPPEKEPPPLPPKIELIPVPPPEKELPKLPPKIELVPVSPPEKELPKLPPKIELVPVSPPEKELPKLPPKIELVPVPPPEKELPPTPPPLPPLKIELVPVPPPEKELPPPKVKLVPISSLEQNEIPSSNLNDDKPFGDMPWSSHPAHHHPHHHHPHHRPPHHPHHHHHSHKKEEDDDNSSLPSTELQAFEGEKELEREKATTFQTTSADPTPPEGGLAYPPFFMPKPTSEAPPPLTIPNSEPYPLIPTTFKTVPASKQDDEDEDDDEGCCSCESWQTTDESGVKSRRTSACQDLEQARRELKAIFDKIKKKLKCGRQTQTPAITT